MTDKPTLPSAQPLTEDMIRVSRDSIGVNGRLVRDKPFKAWVREFSVKDERGRARRFASPSKARAAARKFIAEHNQALIPACDTRELSDDELDLRDGLPLDAHDPETLTPTSTQRWTRQGRILSFDGVEALEVGRFASTHNTFKLSPVTCDAIADYVCSMLNTINIDALTRIWIHKP